MLFIILVSINQHPEIQPIIINPNQIPTENENHPNLTFLLINFSSYHFLFAEFSRRKLMFHVDLCELIDTCYRAAKHFF